MRTNLTQSEITSYRENGFVVIEDFLTADELARWREAVDEAVAQRGRRKLVRQESKDGWEDRDDNSFVENIFVQRINLWMDNDKMRQLMFNPELGKMAADLAGVDGIRIWHDQALFKPPWGNPTAWHLDNPYWSFYSRNAISIWVALDDSTLENGCLYFMPGTHKSATYDNVPIGENIGDLFTVYEDWADKPTVAAPMKAGSCSFHNGLIAHGAGANMTPGWRRAMTCAYMPDGSTFNGTQNVLPNAYFKELTKGDVIDNDKYVPLIYPHD
ncbi:phytanoyl-CoA dioxygenase family protein [Candidatus Leptofilum sp.]|uniref:phytanoyl-CoA dioxygenase family protein n=1 Tax=Candidatus Leptofilum sp. TaxID=3241576 RepID=UPI003B5900E3